MAEGQQCPNCGGELAANARSGLCPSCLHGGVPDGQLPRPEPNSTSGAPGDPAATADDTSIETGREATSSLEQSVPSTDSAITADFAPSDAAGR